MQKTCLLALVVTLSGTIPFNASAKGFFQQVTDPIVKPVTKATKWVGKQSGITPTVDHANSAPKSA